MMSIRISIHDTGVNIMTYIDGNFVTEFWY